MTTWPLEFSSNSAAQTCPLLPPPNKVITVFFPVEGAAPGAAAFEAAEAVTCALSAEKRAEEEDMVLMFEKRIPEKMMSSSL